MFLGSIPEEFASLSRIPFRAREAPDQFLTPEFLALKHRLDELIHASGARYEEDRLPVVKMTAAGDEVE